MPDVALEIGHVLFIDIVGYTKLSLNQQRAAIEELNASVRGSEQFCKSEAEGQLLKLATGDGMALVFSTNPQAPAQCAVEIARALKARPHLVVRMGIHSGPVNGVVDLSGNPNIAGAGINIAQRVMSCGDAGHILLSKHAAEDLAESERWRPRLHELGATTVKHGTRVEIVNLHDDEIGNPAVPMKLRAVRRRRWVVGASLTGAVIFAAVIAMYLFRSHTNANLASAPEKSIAVLPFENLSSEKENAYFADGVQDEILTNLSKIAELKVISRSSVMHYKSGVERNLRKIGQELGVAHLLEGSVQRAANRVRVNAQLIDARNDTHLWANTYDRDLSDVFAIQSEIATAIADQLQAKLSTKEQDAIKRAPTQNVPAFDLYTHARTLLLNISFTGAAEDNLREAIDLLQQAITRDPKFTAAYASLAEAHENLYTVGGDHTPERLASAEAAIARLREIAPDAGETHLAIARHRYFAFRDYAGARAELAIAARTLPNEPAIFSLSAFIDRRAGKWDESIRELSGAIDRDPRNTFLMQQASLTFWSLRRFPQMAAVLDRALAVDPDAVETQLARAVVELHWHANTRPLHNAVESTLARNPAATSVVAETWVNVACADRDPEALSRGLVALGNRPYRPFVQTNMMYNSRFAEAWLSYLRKDAAGFKEALAGARTIQEQTVQQQPGYAPPICALALIDAMLGNKEQALAEGREAIELVPVSKDALTGNELLAFFAMTCAWAGEKDLAVEQLAKVTSIPSMVNYGNLKLWPVWDPLRGDPRFEKIVASLAPKDAKP